MDQKSRLYTLGYFYLSAIFLTIPAVLRGIAKGVAGSKKGTSNM